MVAPVTSTAGGYGPSSPTQNPDGSQLVDTEDGVPAFVPLLSASGGLSLGQQSSLWQGQVGVPIINAVLIELRVMNALLHSQLGDTKLDLQQMRADEFFNSSLATGVA